MLLVIVTWALPASAMACALPSVTCTSLTVTLLVSMALMTPVPVKFLSVPPEMDTVAFPETDTKPKPPSPKGALVATLIVAFTLPGITRHAVVQLMNELPVIFQCASGGGTIGEINHVRVALENHVADFGTTGQFERGAVRLSLQGRHALVLRHQVDTIGNCYRRSAGRIRFPSCSMMVSPFLAMLAALPSVA